VTISDPRASFLDHVEAREAVIPLELGAAGPLARDGYQRDTGQAMSRDYVESLHRAIDTFNRRDLDAFLTVNDPNVEFTPYERALEGLGPYRGHKGIRTWWEDTFAALPDLRAELYEVRDLGDVTVSRGRLRGTGAGSGASFERTLWMTHEYRDTRVVWWRAFDSEAEALEAAELRQAAIRAR
jgi:ketosteroid isomerase-like protein